MGDSTNSVFERECDVDAAVMDERPAVPPDVPAGTTGHRNPWGVLLVLLLIGILNYIDRGLPGILAEPIRRELGLSDTILGVINGFGFLLVYAVSGNPISRMADSGRHAAVITGSLMIWSLMTLLGSFVRNGWQFGFTRLGVAMGEAGSTPASHAFISSNFRVEKRARALAILALGGALGSMTGLVAGGYLSSLLGWRGTFALMGLLGLVIAPFAYLVLRRHAAVVQASASTADTGRWTDLFQTRSGALVVAGGSLVATAAYANLAFAPAFLMRVHDLTIAQTGIQLGLATGASGMFALLFTAWLADWLGKTDPLWTLRVLVGTMVLATPVLTTGYLIGDNVVAIACIAFGAACLNSYLTLTVVALYRLVSANVRARTSATLLFSTALFGGAGPLFVGLLSDALKPSFGETALGYAMLLVPALTFLASLTYAAASRTYRSDMARVAG